MTYQRRGKRTFSVNKINEREKDEDPIGLEIEE